MFITFEGIDSSGKSTQCAIIAEWMRSEGRIVHLVREPGGTDISERIRAILLDAKHTAMDDVAELYLFSAARAQLVKEMIVPALKDGEIVIADRFYDSTTAYQGYGRGLDLETVRRINDLSSHGIAPDITFFLDISYEESIRRREAIDAGHDRIEQMDRRFFDVVRSGYLQLAEGQPGRFRLIDGTQPVERITQAMKEMLREWIEKHEHGTR